MSVVSGRAAGALLGIVVAASVAGAQQPGAPAAQGTGLLAPPSAGFAAIAGVVDDSLRGGPLAGASVLVLGTSLRAAVTTVDGLFRIDSIPPGEVQILVRHPLLDSLSMTVTSSKFPVAAGRLDEIEISTPSLERFRGRFCPRGGVSSGQAMIAGRVDEADTGAPLTNAVVSLLYIDSAGASKAPRVRTARTNADGFYAICGLPERMDGTVQATAGARSSSEVAVSTRQHMLVAAGFLIASAGHADGTGSAVLTGRIIDVAGRPVPDAQVAVEGGTSIARTGTDGTFRLSGLPSGTTNASVHKIGFAPALQTVHLRKAEPQTMTVALSAATRRLAPVTITAEADKALDKLGFNERLKMAPRSNFVLPDEMRKYENLKLTDIFRSMPGFIVMRADNNNSVLASSRSVNGGQQGCVEIFVDRIPFEQLSPGDLDAAFPPYTIGAIESYPSSATTPAEFRLSGKSCATVVIWTKQKLNRQ